ncbi:hypothetical protein F5Y00DRAFT_267437 [Daldinia vernicosa]|uniref:uncharacterized protein n=1 Tax=Daldinia vernicosa TaxID=114800 RepID=UPI002007F51F|nr:uncharacterized protein F5Y00DRAFT_267437 [Daldinia vernicosa]KAI0854204.1 hypothetical protein F5Y00DRAFT_267437 [Daldinia vernicosa]
MASLALKFVDVLLSAIQLGDSEKSMLSSYFQKHAEHVNENKLAAQALEVVLSSLESNPAITDLHRDVIQNLIYLLQSEATRTQEKQPTPTHHASKPMNTKVSTTPTSGHDEATCLVRGSSSSRGTSSVSRVVGTQKEYGLKDSIYQDGNNSDQPHSSSSATSSERLASDGIFDTAINRTFTRFADNTVTRRTQHTELENPDHTSLKPVNPIHLHAKKVSDRAASPFSVVADDSGLLVRNGEYKGSNRMMLPHEWREPIPLEKLQGTQELHTIGATGAQLRVCGSSGAQSDNDIVKGFVQQLTKNNTEASWVDEPPNANQGNAADYNHWGSYQPGNPGYASRRRGPRRGGGAPTGANQSTQNSKGDPQLESQGGIRTPPRRRRRRDTQKSDSVFYWGPGSEEKKTSFMKWKDTIEVRGSPTPSESVSQYTPGWTSDLAENLRNHPPKPTRDIW